MVIFEVWWRLHATHRPCDFYPYRLVAKAFNQYLGTYCSLNEFPSKMFYPGSETVVSLPSKLVLHVPHTRFHYSFASIQEGFLDFSLTFLRLKPILITSERCTHFSSRLCTFCSNLFNTRVNFLLHKLSFRL